MAVVLDLLRVQRKQNDLVQVVHRDIIKIPIHIQVPLVKVVLLRAAVVLDL